MLREFAQSYLLNLVIFFPVAAALLVLLQYRLRRDPDAAKRLAVVLTVVEFALSLPLAWYFEPSAGYQFEVIVPWINVAGINVVYHLGVDGVSLWLVILSTLIVPIALLASYRAIDKRVIEYLVLMLVLETGMVGVFVALDLFLFYVFWEVMLIPMYFIIGVWGGERRIYAAIKFVLYTMVGSLLMLAAIIAIYVIHGGATGEYTFDIVRITQAINGPEAALKIPIAAQYWLFGSFALAFLIKVPLFPFHTWLPDAHVEAPTAGSVILASVLLKMGTYGLIRFNLPWFREASIELAPLICTLAVIGVVYGALVAMVQPDIKKLVAYSSVSHLGFCVLGIFSFTPAGLQGALYQMLAHGLSTGALFLIIGIIYERRHTRLIAEFGGLATPMPMFSTLFMITTFASVGLPLLCGFVGEFLVLYGTFTSTDLVGGRWFAAVAATAMVWGAVYMLWMYQRVVMGDTTRSENAELPDLDTRERWVLVPLVLLMIVMGVFPFPFTSRSQPALDHAIGRYSWIAAEPPTPAPRPRHAAAAVEGLE
jgi:NADH-quinone oxidoreductase subunit M